MWVSPSLLNTVAMQASALVGRSFEMFADRSTQATIAHLLAGPSWTDRDFANVRLVLLGSSGPVALMLRSVRYTDRDGARIAFVRFDRSPDQFDALGGVRSTTERSLDLGLDLDLLPVDDLTGLALRPALFARLDGADFDESAVVVVVDVDEFGQVNARLGSEAGDEILVEFGARLAATVRGGDFAARLSGDRFAVVSAVVSVVEARAIATRIDRVLSEPFEVGGSLISIPMSIGVSWGQNAGSARSLFNQAEVALNEAQVNGGRQLRYFEPKVSADQWPDPETFAVDLRTALATGQISVAYQPIVVLTSGHLEKLEALARWNHPDRGEIAPTEFIRLAERSGTIVELGEWILNQVCSDLVLLKANGLSTEIAVNMSVLQLRDPKISQIVTRVLARHGIDPSHIWIEVTEGVLLDDKAIATLHDLHDLGIHLVIDDFGTGYATFRYLTRLPFDALKIDVAFVGGLGIDASDTAIVRSVLNLGRELGMQVVAEGVETESQRAQLSALGCRLAQGWLFDRALPIHHLIGKYGSSADRSIDPVQPSTGGSEAERLAAVRACKVLDTSAEASYDSVALLATQILRTPMGLVTLLDSDRQWFKARVGVDVAETSREMSFCNVAIVDPYRPLVVADTLLDKRFAENPMVTGGPRIRSYAGVPIRSREGLPLGTLCVLDVVARGFSTEQISQLTMLAEQTGAMLDLRRRAGELNDLLHQMRPGVLPRVEGHADVTALERDAASAVGRAVVTLERVTARREDTSIQPSDVGRFGRVELQMSPRAVVVDGLDVTVSDREFDLLAFLAAHAGHAFTRTELLHAVWHSAPDWHDAATVTAHIDRLRSKIELDPAHPLLLRSVRGVGYRFVAPEEPARGDLAAELAPRVGEFVHDDTSIVAASPGMLQLLMTDQLDDVVGHDIFDLIAPSSRPAAQARLEMRKSGHAPGPQVLAMQTVDGAEIVTMIRSEEALFGALPAVVVSVREVVDPPEPIHRLVNGIIDEVSDAVIITDPELHVLSWNPAAERLYGWSEREVLGHTLQNVVRSLQPFELTSLRPENGGAGRWTADARHVTRSGSIVDVTATITVITDDTGATTTVVAVIRPEREGAFIQPAFDYQASNRADVQRAVRRNEFVVYYEPVVRIADRSIQAVNVRVRWLRPDGATWDLADFVDDIEHADSLGDLARYVYPTAFLQFERWRRAGHSIELSIDVTLNQLADQRFLDVLSPVVVRLRAAGSVLWLKLRGCDLCSANAQTRTALDELAAAGAQLCAVGLDSGRTDAGDLERFGIGAVEFDAATLSTAETPENGISRAIAVSALAEQLGVPVWVENVVEEQQHRAAVRLGCDLASGALYGGPTRGDRLDIDARTARRL